MDIARPWARLRDGSPGSGDTRSLPPRGCAIDASAAVALFARLGRWDVAARLAAALATVNLHRGGGEAAPHELHAIRKIQQLPNERSRATGWP